MITTPKTTSIWGDQSPSDRSAQGRNLGDVAYDRIEDAIVHLKFKPGTFTTIAAIQDDVALGRTPVLEAIRRLSNDTLVNVQSRRGLQIAPIQLDRERLLLRLRRDVERHVVELATERATSVHRNQMHQLIRAMDHEAQTGHRQTGDIQAFNEIDRRLDMLVLEAADEPLMVRTLRPLHTMFRRTGYIYLAHLDPEGQAFTESIKRHSLLLTAIAQGRKADAVTAASEVIGLAETMFDTLARNIDPVLLDANIKPLSL